jgi:hypothetical protein
MGAPLRIHPAREINLRGIAMTISTYENKINYVGDGSTTVFTFVFKVLAENHMKVYLDDVIQGTGYTVTLNADQNANPGGDVTFSVAPVTDAVISLLREVPLDQLVDYNPYDPFPAETHERALDKLTMITQQLDEKVDRAILFPPSTALPDDGVNFPPYDAGTAIIWSETVENELDTSEFPLPVYVQQAEAARDAAEGYRDETEVFRDETQAIYDEFDGRYLGSKTAPPTVDNEGNPLLDGALYWNSTLGEMFVWNDTTGNWEAIAGAALFVQEEQTATAGQTVFTLTQIGYEPGTNSLVVYRNGIRLRPSDFTETDQITVTLDEACSDGDEMLFAYGEEVSTADADAKNVSYTPAGTGAVTTTVQAKLRESVSVKDFGATGDGVTDDTSAIQAALDSGASNIYIPEGTYNVSSTLNITSSINLKGNGIIQQTVSGITTIYITVSNVSIDGISVYGNDTTDVYVANSRGIYALGGSNISPISNISIANCSIKYFGYTALEFQYVNELLINKNQIKRIGMVGIRNLTVKRANYTNNHIEDIYPGNGGAAPYLNAYGISLSSSGSDDRPQDCVVDGNTLINIPSWEGIDTHSGKNIVISNNSLRDVRTAIAITTNAAYDCENIAVIGNVSEGFSNGEYIRDATTYETGSGCVAKLGEVGRQGRGCSIVGNTFKRHGGRVTGQTSGAILVERTKIANVVGNTILDAYRYGIRIADNTNEVSVTGNSINNVIEIQSTRHGISFAGMAEANCDNNSVGSSGNDAYYVASPSSSAYKVAFGSGNTTPDGTQIMESTSMHAIKSGSFLGEAKAWIRFNGSTGEVFEYHNCALVKNGTGDYTINYDYSIPNNVVVASSNQYSTRVVSMNNANCLVKTYDSSNVDADASPIALAVFGFLNT